VDYKLEMSLVCVDEAGIPKRLGIAANVEDCGYATPQFIKLTADMMTEAIVRKADGQKMFNGPWVTDVAEGEDYD
jgi:hypothetical protein